MFLVTINSITRFTIGLFISQNFTDITISWCWKSIKWLGVLHVVLFVILPVMWFVERCFILASCAGVYILIAAGGLVMLVGFFGCCGAVRESQCLLGLVSEIVLILLVQHWCQLQINFVKMFYPFLKSW